MEMLKDSGCSHADRNPELPERGRHETSSGRVSSCSMEFIPHEIDQDVFVLVADGGINRDNAKVFTNDVEAMVSNGFNKLIIDCSKLEYISSTGLGTLLVLSKRMKAAGGDVKLCSLKGIVAQALQLIRLDHLFGIYPDLGQARLAFRSVEEQPSDGEV